MKVNVAAHEAHGIQRHGAWRLAVAVFALCLLGLAAQSGDGTGSSRLAFLSSSSQPSRTLAEAQPGPADGSASAWPSASHAATPGSGESAGAVPPGFRPSGVSFINEADGWVIGEAPCGEESCTVVVRTRDGGRHWEAIGAPVTPGESQTGKSTNFVSDVRFADATNGWAFNRELWATHDGGKSWQRLPLGSTVMALETSAGRVYAVVGDCGAEFASCNRPFHLYEADVGTDDWRPVPEVELPHWSLGQLVGRGEAVYVVADAEPPVFFARTEAGQWERRQLPCGEGGHHTLALSDVDDLVYACQTGEGVAGQVPNELHVSSDGGRSWTRIGKDTYRGYAAAMAAAHDAIFLAVAPADDLLLTTNAGRSWSVVLEAPYIRSVRFSGDRHGVVMSGTTSEGQLFTTGDGGSSWEQVRFAT